MERWKVAAIQLNSGEDLDLNLRASLRLCQDAIEQDCSLIALPESYAGIASPRRPDISQEWTVDSVQPEKSKAISPFLELSKKSSAVIVLGGIPERLPTESKRFNTAFVLAHGEIVARYRKIHLFDYTTPGGIDLQESNTTEPGQKLCIVETPIGVLGLSICYDLRFPELYRRMSEAGAEVIVVPSAFTETTGRAHWLPLLKARAIENLAYIVAPAQFGTHGAGDNVRRSFGHSAVVGPWGNILKISSSAQESCLTAEVDRGELSAVRAKLPALNHRRVTDETPMEVVTLALQTTRGGQNGAA